MIERTLVLIKPDGVVRGLIGELIKRFEQRGLKIIGLKLVHADRKFAEKHYTEEIAERHGKKVREGLLIYITEGPLVAIVFEGAYAINVVRKIVGSTYPYEAPVGTIRGDFAHISKEYANSKETKEFTPGLRNLIHASGNKEEAKEEIKLWFKDIELYSYKCVHDEHVI